MDGTENCAYTISSLRNFSFVMNGRLIEAYFIIFTIYRVTYKIFIKVPKYNSILYYNTFSICGVNKWELSYHKSTKISTGCGKRSQLWGINAQDSETARSW